MTNQRASIRNVVVTSSTTFRFDFDVTSGEDRIASIAGGAAVDGYDYMMVVDPTGQAREFSFDFGKLRKTIKPDSIINIVVKIIDRDGDAWEMGFSKMLAVENEDCFLNGLSVSQRTDGSLIVDIHYDLIGPYEVDPSTVELWLSDDGGVTYDLPTDSLEGDVGDGVPMGTRRHVTWDPKVDYPDGGGKTVKARLAAYSYRTLTYSVAESGIVTLAAPTSTPVLSLVSDGEKRKYGVKGGELFKNLSMDFVAIRSSSSSWSSWSSLSSASSVSSSSSSRSSISSSSSSSSKSSLSSASSMSSSSVSSVSTDSTSSPSSLSSPSESSPTSASSMTSISSSSISSQSTISSLSSPSSFPTSVSTQSDISSPTSESSPSSDTSTSLQSIACNAPCGGNQFTFTGGADDGLDVWQNATYRGRDNVACTSISEGDVITVKNYDVGPPSGGWCWNAGYFCLTLSFGGRSWNVKYLGTYSYCFGTPVGTATPPWSPAEYPNALIATIQVQSGVPVFTDTNRFAGIQKITEIT